MSDRAISRRSSEPRSAGRCGCGASRPKSAFTCGSCWEALRADQRSALRAIRRDIQRVGFERLPSLGRA